MEGTGTINSKLRDLIFFILLGLVLICSVVFRSYVKNHDLLNNGLLVPNYVFLIRPLISVSIALLIAGFLIKVGLIDIRQLSPKLKKNIFFVGLAFAGVTVFYMLLMSGLYMGNRYIETDNWVKVAINSKFYNTLTLPLRTAKYYQEAFLVRDAVGTIGAIFIFASKTKLGNSQKRERANPSNPKKFKEQMTFILFCGIIFIFSVIFGIYVKHVDPSGDNTLQKATYLILVKPLIFISAALLIGGLISKIGLLDVNQLSEKASKVLFALGIILVSLTVFYLILLGVVCTGLQYSTADNWVKTLIHTKLYITLTQPFFTNIGEEMFLFLNISGTLGALFLFLAKMKFLR